jgi:hypothetical protein
MFFNALRVLAAFQESVLVAKPSVLFTPALLARFFSNQKVLLSTDFGYIELL